MYILDSVGVQFISSVFNLKSDRPVQDWELEFANFTRMNEFIDYYQNSEIAISSKRALFALIISSAEKGIEEEMNLIPYIKKIVEIVERDQDELKDIVEYWTASSPDQFPIGELLGKNR